MAGSSLAAERSAAAELRTTRAVRVRAQALLERAREGGSRWFTVDDNAIHEAAAAVAELTVSRYPDLAIPYHSRWRHFEAGGVDRRSELDAQLSRLDDTGRARAMVDLTVISVLLDAGAGAQWHFDESESGLRFSRSEGLAVASLHAFTAGMFSCDPAEPLRADASALSGLTADRLASAFQVSATNPLVGIDGRVQLLHRLGRALAAQPEVFGEHGRPGCLFDTLAATRSDVAAHDILSLLLTSFSGIWLGGNSIGVHDLGDCWHHQAVPGPALTRGWMPFHKLSQWLTYSLLEPFEWSGVHVHGLDALTGLPEYRNGGLLIDTGVLRLRDPVTVDQTWSVADELVVEWRALTVALLDELAPAVRARLGVDSTRLPLACVLEGGTWATGRALAQQLRDGLPPLTIRSDGTVF